MSKQEVSALIQAIQETATFLLQKGLTGRPKIIVKQNDDIFVDGIVDDYSDDINTIIDNLPDDPEPIPVVSFDYAGNFTLSEVTNSENVNGGFGTLNKSHTKGIVSLIGWSSGGIEPKVTSGKVLNNLIGWDSGGNFATV